MQPPEPLEEWKSPPFEPTERDGNLYARGAVDDKGQMWMHVKALESLLATGGGRLPVNVRVIVEGEEEVGGEGIAAFVREHPEELRADVALVSDTEMFAPDLPTLCVGLRGMIYTEIEARGARTDLHSGMYGGAAPNPLVALAQIIAKLKTSAGRILIPHFYDRVAAPTASGTGGMEGAAVRRRGLPRDGGGIDGADRRGWILGPGTHLGAAHAGCTRDCRRLHRRGGEDGDSGARGGEGFDAAGARDEADGELSRCTRRMWRRSVRQGITLEVRLIHSGDPVVVSTDNPYVRAATSAMHEVFGKETVFVRGGGSIPIVGDFIRELGIPTLLMGFRPARRQPARAQREVPPGKLPSRHRVDRALSGECRRGVGLADPLHMTYPVIGNFRMRLGFTKI